MSDPYSMEYGPYSTNLLSLSLASVVVYCYTTKSQCTIKRFNWIGLFCGGLGGFWGAPQPICTHARPSGVLRWHFQQDLCGKVKLCNASFLDTSILLLPFIKFTKSKCGVAFETFPAVYAAEIHPSFALYLEGINSYTA